MEKKNENKFLEYTIAGFLTILVVILLYGVSWISVCGVVKLITLCFGWNFNWAISTGIWLILVLIKSWFSQSK